MLRTRRDRCPGVVRPWPADDGPLVRVRLVGGELSADALRGLADVAATFGDGDLHLTTRANLQLRGVEHGEPFLRAVEALGLLPSREHDQARNILVSPLTGRVGGRVDLRPVAVRLDEMVRADPDAAGLPGRFLLTLDDGRGDLVDRPTDLGLVALDATTVQLRVGDDWGEVVALDDAPAALHALVRAFLRARGDGVDAAWHVTELDRPLTTPCPADLRVPEPEPPGPCLAGLGDAVVVVPDGVLGPDLVDLVTGTATGTAAATGTGGPVILTPWHSIIRTDLLP